MALSNKNCLQQSQQHNMEIDAFTNKTLKPILSHLYSFMWYSLFMVPLAHELQHCLCLVLIYVAKRSSCFAFKQHTVHGKLDHFLRNFIINIYIIYIFIIRTQRICFK